MLTILTAAAGLSGCGNTKLLAQKDSEIEAKDQQIMELQQEIMSLRQEREHTDQLNEDLEAALSSLQEKHKLSLSSDKNQSMITLPNKVTFDSGSAQLTDEGKQIIDTVWEVLSRYPERKILVEGHTDNVPIAPEYQHRYKSNWELSSARALAVVHYVQGSFKTDPSRLAAVGCGKYRPIADNETPDGRAANRRVVVVVAKPPRDVAQGQ
jgi:chemotaxis protein MotB